MQSNNQPIFSLEAEQSVIGGIILSPDSFDEVRGKIIGVEFYQAQHREIFLAMKELIAESKPIDVVTIADHLNNKKSQVTLAQLGDIARNTPSVANLLAYAEIVKEKYTQRELLKFANSIESKIYQPSTRELIELTNEIEGELSQITANADTDRSTIMTANDAVHDAILEMEQAKNSNGLLGLETYSITHVT